MIQPQYAQPYSQGTPSANAVNIQIFEPKAYASPQPAMPNYTNQLYAYPQTSLYGGTQPQYMPYQAPMTAPYVPYQAPMMAPYTPYQMPPVAQYPGYPAEQPAVYTVPPQIVTPQQQQMPAPAIEQTVTQEAPTPAPAAEAAPTPQPVAVEQPAQPAQTIDIAGLVAALQSNDFAAQEKAITEIANFSQGEPALAQQVLNEQIMNSLATIVGADTSQLAGPTPEQQAALNKSMKGEQLTPEEAQLASQDSPKRAADRNKIIAMFTLSMLQKNQRDELDAYLASQGNTGIPPLGTDNLIGFNEIQNAVKTDPNPEVRLAGIQAISYMAKPEDAAAIQGALQNSVNDPEPLIQQAANEVLAKFGTAAPAPQAAAQAQTANAQAGGAQIQQFPGQDQAQNQAA